MTLGKNNLTNTSSRMTLIRESQAALDPRRCFPWLLLTGHHKTRPHHMYLSGRLLGLYAYTANYGCDESYRPDSLLERAQVPQMHLFLPLNGRTQCHTAPTTTTSKSITPSPTRIKSLFGVSLQFRRHR